VVVLNGPLGKGRSVANGGLAQRCIANAKHLKFRGHAVKIRADSVKVAVYGHGTFVFDPVAALDVLLLALFERSGLGRQTNSQWHGFGFWGFRQDLS
jgi:hypothetical protein